MSHFNSDQQDYMRSLDEMPPESKCWCGWYPVGQCYSGCNERAPGKTSADKMAVWCPGCHNSPPPDLSRPIVHNIKCSIGQALRLEATQP